MSGLVSSCPRAVCEAVRDFSDLDEGLDISEKKAILVTFPPENTKGSSDDDSSSGDDDSSSCDDDSSFSNDDSSSGGVLIWFSLLITHNYEFHYYNVIFPI
ncbi:hypothetical protein Bca4012_099686 [Brassica carinata]